LHGSLAAGIPAPAQIVQRLSNASAGQGQGLARLRYCGSEKTSAPAPKAEVSVAGGQNRRAH